MESYLTSRKKFVYFNEFISDMKYIQNGVPQESTLDPLLFLIYINDILSFSKIFNFLINADDTTLYCCLKDLNSEDKEQC